MENEKELKDRKERAQLRLQIWLGQAKFQSKWREETPSGEVAVYAETVSTLIMQSLAGKPLGSKNLSIISCIIGLVLRRKA